MREKDIKTKEKEDKKRSEEEKKGVPKKRDDCEEVLDPTQYTNNRRQFLEKLRAEGKNPYPHKFERTHRIDEFVKAFDSVCSEPDKFHEDKLVSLTGRVLSIRG